MLTVRNWKPIVTVTMLLLLSSPAMAASTVTKRQFADIYQSIVEKMRSSASLNEKIQYLRIRDKEYVSLYKKMRLEAKTDPSIRNSPVYMYGWDLYDRIIPLLSLQLDSGKTRLTRKSCLEAAGLVSSGELPPPVDEALPELSPEAKETMKLIRDLCGDSLR